MSGRLFPLSKLEALWRTGALLDARPVAKLTTLLRIENPVDARFFLDNCSLGGSWADKNFLFCFWPSPFSDGEVGEGGVVE